jgi:ribonuclease P protein component
MALNDGLRCRKTLKKEERIHLERDFQRAFKQGKRITLTFFTVIMTPNQLPWRRMAVIVPKRVGKAVKRNRLRRLVREFFRLNKCKLAPSHDYIFLAHKGAEGLKTYWEVEKVLKGLFEEEGRGG